MPRIGKGEQPTTSAPSAAKSTPKNPAKPAAEASPPPQPDDGSSAPAAEEAGESPEDDGPKDHRTSKAELSNRLVPLLVKWGGKRSGAKTLANELVELVLSGQFEYVLRDGYFRFPDGHGALRVQDVKGGIRTVPRSGKKIQTHDRRKLSYQMGKTIKDALNAGVPDSYYIDEAGNKIEGEAPPAEADE